MREFVGTYEELSKTERTEDFVRIVLTDEDYIIDIKHKLEANFPNIMEIVYDNTYTRENKVIEKAQIFESQSPLELFKTFYELQNNKELDGEKLQVVKELLENQEEAV